MAFARHGSGPLATLRALASQVHPVFMLPAVAAGGFGAVLADRFSGLLFVVHATAVFAALYTAHVKDGYVDFHRRDEDDDHPLTARGCRFALAGASVLFFACLALLLALVDPWAALLTLPGWLIGYHHAPQLDTNPVTATSGYPAGIAFALLSGYYVQARALSPVVVAFAAVFLVILSGIKVVDDAKDYEYDRSAGKRTVAVAFAAVFLVILSGIKVVDDAKDYEYDRSAGKRTVAVVLGRARARAAACALMAAGLLAVVGFAVAAVFPPSSVLAVLAFAAVAVATRRADSELATMLLIRGSYVFLAVLVAAVWFRPLE